MTEKDKYIPFRKFVEKANSVNSNLIFNRDDWIPQENTIKAKCKKHDIEFYMYKSATLLNSN